jgi:F like protein
LNKEQFLLEYEKGLAQTTITALRSIFGAVSSALALYMMRSDATANWVAYRADAADTIQSASDTGQDYVVWRTAEDETTCDYCGPLDWKIVMIDQLDQLGYPPAHVNCRCKIEPVTEAYGRDVPIEYYHRIPQSWDEWDGGDQGIVKPERIRLMLYDVVLEKKIKNALEKNLQ